MPIYAYVCSSCGLHKDVMQKISDAPLGVCPQCGKETFAKKLTAASFQLKGSGYYATDFKGGPKRPEMEKPDALKREAGTEPVAASAGSESASAAGCTD
ncbi:MAG TPA: zinc ribbon domain-containing protein [Gallionella sp.]|nr:zinc ribbon domain-containing protein [Gallionella sp.]